MIVLNDTLGAVGGSHTLFLRMCGWYRNHGLPVCFFCNNRDNEDIANELERIGVRIFVVDTGNAKETYKLLHAIDDGDIRVINFWWNMYLNIEAVIKKYKIHIDNIIYLIHPKCLIKGDSYKAGSKLIGMIKSSYRNMLPQMCENEAIISMDEINIDETEKYYGIKLSPKPQIIRLPMKIDPVDKEKVILNGFRSKTIMTSCRADFPYKGYVVGLIDEFVKLKKQYHDIKLKIVCDGSDIGILKGKIDGIASTYKKDIMLFGWMSYEELKDMMNECMVYIGMGSSLLDSSLRYKPSAVIKFYTMECIGIDYTAENPYDLAAKDEITTNAAEMISRVLRMEFNEYKEFSEKSYNTVSELYGIDSVMEKFMSHRNTSQNSILRIQDSFLVSTNNLVNSIRFRNTKEKSSVQHLS